MHPPLLHSPMPPQIAFEALTGHGRVQEGPLKNGSHRPQSVPVKYPWVAL